MGERQTSETILRVLRKRDGIATSVLLTDGEILRVVNIAWGYDTGAVHAHVTTNISPQIEGETVGFFRTDEVRALLDPVIQTVQYAPPDDRARRQ